MTFIRPAAFLLLIPLAIIFFNLFKVRSLKSWQNICDPHLLPYLFTKGNEKSRIWALLLLLMSIIFMILALAGPSISTKTYPYYQSTVPRVILLSLAGNMLKNDVPPNRLQRAKFIMQDLFQTKNSPLFGLIVYTNEPFVAAPLTLDGETILALTHELTPSIMPLGGNRLSLALKKAEILINQAGFKKGEILVITGSPPIANDNTFVKTLAAQAIKVSILPIGEFNNKNQQSFAEFAANGNGSLLSLAKSDQDIKNWLQTDDLSQKKIQNEKITQPIDEGRWFLIPALLCFLPIFWGNFVKRIVP